MIDVVFVSHVAETAEVKVMATGAFPAHPLNSLLLAGITDDVGMTHTCKQSPSIPDKTGACTYHLVQNFW